VALEVEGESSASEGGGGGGAWRGTGLREGDTKEKRRVECAEARGREGASGAGRFDDDNISFFLVVGLSWPLPSGWHPKILAELGFIAGGFARY
jgi:hypothetical protein